MRHIDQDESDAILAAMRQVALAGGALTAVDRTSISAAGRYLLRRTGSIDCDALPAVGPVALAATLETPELKSEAVKYLAVMTMVDGMLDEKKVARLLD